MCKVLPAKLSPRLFSSKCHWAARKRGQPVVTGDMGRGGWGAGDAKCKSSREALFASRQQVGGSRLPAAGPQLWTPGL